MNLQQVLQPATIKLQILGYNFGKLSKLKILHTITSLIVCLVVTFFYWKNRKVKFGFALNKVVFTAAVSRSLGTILVMIMVLSLGYLGYFNKIVVLTKKISDIDQVFSEFGLDIGTLNQKHRKILVVLVLVNLFLHGLVDWSTVRLVPLNPYQFLVAVVYPRMVVSTFNIVFYVYTQILEERFKLMNLIIVQEQYFSKKIKSLVVLHKTLVKVARKLNQIFGPQLLLWVLLSVMVVTLELHVFFFSLFNKLLGQYPTGTIAVKNASLFIFDLIFIAHRCNKLCNEANKTVFLCYSFKVDINDEETRNDFTKLQLKLSNKLEITACRVFKIDNSLFLEVSIKVVKID
ncbi:uncharacterized protein LOC123009724 [Tribolium madens]|uniref:uncharacterized protein LOC123009724 n=1 Tax=Tribolium madens TaxID=41895 RepID=UPI001CF721EA|nr:uncharacterized protein LOC123009724 [Tribolium madens]